MKALQKEGFEITWQKGSHAPVTKYIEGEKLTFPVPVHKDSLDNGILLRSEVVNEAK